jgi:type IV pilus assembly protein PilA
MESKGKASARNFLIRFLIFLSLIVGGGVLLTPRGISCYSKPRQVESKVYVASMNRGQHSYFIEKQTFTNSITLEIGIPVKTDSYSYYSRIEPKILTSDYEISIVKNYSQPRVRNMVNYFGLAWVITPLNKDNITRSTQPVANTLLCQTNLVNLIPSSEDRVEFSKDFKSASCPKGMVEVK